MTDPEHHPVDSVSRTLRVTAAWTWRLLIVGLGIYVVLRLFQRVELVAFSFVLALFFTAVLHPLERYLRRLPGPRSVSAALTLLIGLAVLAGIATFVVFQINDHASQLGDQIDELAKRVGNYLKNGPLHLKSTDLDNAASNIKKAIQSNSGVLVSGAIKTAQTIFEIFGALLLVLLSTFFLLRDGDQIWKWALGLFPAPARERIDNAGRAGWHSLGGYVRGQVLIALFHGVAVTIVLLVLQIPLAAALGVVIFLGSFIPIIGLVIAGALCAAVAILEHGLTAGIVVVVAITVLVQLESHLLQPLIMSRSVQVHPLAIALSVLTGTVVAGIVGALLAVPLVAFLNTTILTLRRSPVLPVGDSNFPMHGRTSPGGEPVDLAVHPDAEDGEVDEVGQDDEPDDETGEPPSANV